MVAPVDIFWPRNVAQENFFFLERPLEPPPLSMSMPTGQQIYNVYVAFRNLSAACDDHDTDTASAACEDVIRASRVILAVLGGPDSDVSDASSSEESAPGLGPAGEADSSNEDCELGNGDGDDSSDGDCDCSAGDSPSGESGADDGSSTSAESGSEDSESTSEADSSDDDDRGHLVADYSGHADPSRHCDRCGYSGHTNQYCPTLPEPKRRRL